jgi:protein TonB
MATYFTPRFIVHFSLYASLATLSPVGELVAGGGLIIAGRPMPNSAFHWPKSSPQFDTPPNLISGNAPVYPIAESRSGIPGFAVVAFTIGRDGKTYDIHVVQASAPYFGSHTVLAVRDWKFEPARKNGQPVPVKVQITLPFRYSNQPP